MPFMPLSSATPRIRPPALRPGDTVGIIAPAAAIQRDLLEAGCARLCSLGYRPFYFDSILDQDLYFAGSADRRAREVEEMFERNEVRAVLCARGGYGANYLLGRIDPEKIARHPKILVGYSDVTTLLTWFCDAAQMVTFHGPMVTKDFARPDGVHLGSWEAALQGSADWQVNSSVSGATTLAGGTAEGILYGGCLSMLVASLGTPYEIRTEGTILFLEDVAAKPFQIDRMLMQLKLAGKLDAVRGMVFGEMMDCVQHPEQPYTLEEIVVRIVRDLGIPVAFGFRSGHVSRENITLPLGVRALLAANESGVTLTLLEAATAPADVAQRSGKTA
jgi:muramoyltetrapeptide carboxypeptidase